MLVIVEMIEDLETISRAGERKIQIPKKKIELQTQDNG